MGVDPGVGVGVGGALLIISRGRGFCIVSRLGPFTGSSEPSLRAQEAQRNLGIPGFLMGASVSQSGP